LKGFLKRIKAKKHHHYFILVLLPKIKLIANESIFIDRIPVCFFFQSFGSKNLNQWNSKGWGYR
jgi:hypothetical protein